MGWKKTLVYRSKDKDDWETARKLLEEEGITHFPFVANIVPFQDLIIDQRVLNAEPVRPMHWLFLVIPTQVQYPITLSPPSTVPVSRSSPHTQSQPLYWTDIPGDIDHRYLVREVYPDLLSHSHLATVIESSESFNTHIQGMGVFFCLPYTRLVPDVPDFQNT